MKYTSSMSVADREFDFYKNNNDESIKHFIKCIVSVWFVGLKLEWAKVCINEFINSHVYKYK